MNILNNCLTAAAILSLCSFAACKKLDTQPKAIEDYIPADAILAAVSSPDINISKTPFITILNESMDETSVLRAISRLLKHEDQLSDDALFGIKGIESRNVNQLGVYIKSSFSTTIVTFISADKARETIDNSMAQCDSTTRTVGSGNRKWLICGPFPKHGLPESYIAYHAAGNTLFIAISPSLDEKTLDAILDKPAAANPVSQIKQHKDAAIIASLDNIALRNNPAAFHLPFDVPEHEISDFFKDENLTSDFVSNFPTTQFVLRSNDKSMSLELLFTIADSAAAARLSSLLIPSRILPTDSQTDSAQTSLHINIDMLKALDFFTEILSKVKIENLPHKLQRKIQEIKEDFSNEAIVNNYHALLSHYGAVTAHTGYQDNLDNFIIDIEGKNLTEKLPDSSVPDNPGNELTPITLSNVFLPVAIGYLPGHREYKDGTIEADKVNPIKTFAYAYPVADTFFAGANKDRIVLGYSEKDVKSLLDSKPQFATSKDFIDYSILFDQALRKEIFGYQTKPISTVTFGIGPAENGLKLHMDLIYKAP